MTATETFKATGKRAYLRTRRSEWSVCWVQDGGDVWLVKWMRFGKPQRERIAKRDVVTMWIRD